MFGIAFIVIANRIDNQSIKGIYEHGSIWVYSSLHIKPGNARWISPIHHLELQLWIIGGLSSFLLLTGLYSTAVSLSKHAELRKSIRNSIEDQHSRLIDRHYFYFFP